MNDLNQWYRESPLGKLLKNAEHQALSKLLQTIFGYHLLLTGVADDDLVKSSRIRQHTVVCPDGLNTSDVISNVNSESLTQNKVAIAACAEQLPIQTDSVDAVVLYHTLDFSADPHEVLREAERVLVPEGFVVIVGFNPRSLWGLARFLLMLSKRVPWKGKFISTTRIKDWVRLLGFELCHMEKVFFRPPIQHESTLGKLEFMERAGNKVWPYFGASYIITARKKVSTMTPIKPRWQPRSAVVTGLADSARYNSRTQHDQFKNRKRF